MDWVSMEQVQTEITKSNSSPRAPSMNQAKLGNIPENNQKPPIQAFNSLSKNLIRAETDR